MVGQIASWSPPTKHIQTQRRQSSMGWEYSDWRMEHKGDLKMLGEGLLTINEDREFQTGITSIKKA